MMGNIAGSPRCTSALAGRGVNGYRSGGTEGTRTDNHAGQNPRRNQALPETGYLLTAVFPSLTLEQADRILTETEGPGGGFLDNGSAFGVYSRLNLPFMLEELDAARSRLLTYGRD